MNGLEAAIERREWEAAALYVVLGVTRAAGRLPEGTAADLLALLSAPTRRRGGR